MEKACNFRRIITVAIILYPLLFIWQGLDFTDTGFMLTNFQQILNDPASVESSFRIWLTNLLGGIWIYFFGDSLGLIGYKLMAVFLAWGTLYLAYLVLRPYIDKTNLLGGLLIAEIVINRSGYNFNYNSLTAFFFLLALYFLIIGLRRESKGYLVTTGIVLGANIFIRLPNILGLVLIIGILFYGLKNNTSWAKQIEQVKQFLVGYFSGILALLLLMYGMGQLKGYLAALTGTFQMLLDPSSHHSGGRLTNLFVTHHERVIENLGFNLVVFFGLIFLLNLTARFKVRALQLGLIIGSFAVSFFYYWKSYQNWFLTLVTLLGIIYLVHLLIIADNSKAKVQYSGDYQLVVFLSLLVLFLTPLGSNVGIYNSVYGMYLAIPITFNYILSRSDFRLFLKLNSSKGSDSRLGLNLTSGELKLIRNISLGLFIIFLLHATYYYTYRETKYRSSLVYSVQHERLKGVLTTQERARVVQELVDVLPQYINEDDYLLAYEQIPLVYFLTKTRPYLYGAWPMLYSPEKFKASLQRAQSEKEELPVIVRAKGSTESFVWPKTIRLSKEPNLEAIRAVMKDFVSANHYKLAWENSFFEILIPAVGE